MSDPMSHPPEPGYLVKPGDSTPPMTSHKLLGASVAAIAFHLVWNQLGLSAILPEDLAPDVRVIVDQAVVAFGALVGGWATPNKVK